MALFRALESARPAGRRLFEDRAATRFLGPRLRAVAYAAKLPPLRRLIVSFMDRRWPGPRLSGVARTRVIDDFVVDAIHGGCTQLMLLGAGYDARATRLSVATSIVAFEVDHPMTQARKRKALGNDPENVRYVPLDFELDPMAAALLAAGFDREQRTCVLWEGVYSYLTPEAIDVTLAALVRLCSPGSQILLTYVDQRVLDAPDSPPRAWLAAVRDAGEPFRTGLDPGEASAFFAARNLLLTHDESTTEAAQRLGAERAQSIPGFYRIATLEVGEEPLGAQSGAQAPTAPRGSRRAG
jgi:methyltransferase (TIGR00027 family)